MTASNFQVGFRGETHVTSIRADTCIVTVTTKADRCSQSADVQTQQAPAYDVRMKL